jgi:hypothetical protein
VHQSAIAAAAVVFEKASIGLWHGLFTVRCRGQHGLRGNRSYRVLLAFLLESHPAAAAAAFTDFGIGLHAHCALHSVH